MTRANARQFDKTQTPELVRLDLPDRGSLHLGIDISAISALTAGP